MIAAAGWPGRTAGHPHALQGRGRGGRVAAGQNRLWQQGCSSRPGAREAGWKMVKLGCSSRAAGAGAGEGVAEGQNRAVAAGAGEAGSK